MYIIRTQRDMKNDHIQETLLCPKGGRYGVLVRVKIIAGEKEDYVKLIKQKLAITVAGEEEEIRLRGSRAASAHQAAVQ